MRRGWWLVPWWFCGLVGCGGDDLDVARVVDGVVEAPDGRLAGESSLWNGALVFLAGAAHALTGIEPVGAGEEVRLEVIDGTGEVIQLLETVATRADGTYSQALASDEELGSSMLVSVGEDATLMRAFVSSEAVDINPATEATVRLLLESGYPLARFSAAELETIQDAVDEATADVPAGTTVATANARAEEQASDDEDVQAAIAAAGAS